eukprot:418484-Rhodomonas_salina.1
MSRGCTLTAARTRLTRPSMAIAGWIACCAASRRRGAERMKGARKDVLRMGGGERLGLTPCRGALGCGSIERSSRLPTEM